MTNFKFQISNFKFTIIGYLIAAIGLFIYSFTQIDLGLTLSQSSAWQIADKFFKNIGYFQRPLSGTLFSVIVILLFAFYFLILNSIRKGKISGKTIWFLIIAVTGILTFSYNAFSYDLFNYIFDAKIVTFYHQNPYLHMALDYASDPMLGFMHWTHRTYPYGPTWLGLTVPLSFLGMRVFLPTFFLFKMLASLGFLGATFYIGKILRRVAPKDELFGVAFFALNPLVVIESLVSAHNDIVMMYFALSSLYLMMNIKYARSILMFILSVGVKFASAAILPVYLWSLYLQKKKKTINWQKMFVVMTGIMIIPIILATYRTTFQPWYLLNILTFAALVSRNYYVFIPSAIISFVATFEYLPFLYSGNWNNPIPSILTWMTLGAIGLSLLLTLVWRFKKVLR